MDLQSIRIERFGSRSFLQIGNESIEISDYKISSSAHGGAELEVKLSVSKVTAEEFELGATKESFQPPSLTATNGAP